MWLIYALLSAVMAALVAIFGKLGIAKIDTTLATTIRAIIMAIFLFVTSFLLGKWRGLDAIHGKAWVYILLAGIAGALSWLFYFTALKNGPASSVAAIDRLSVAFVLLLAVLLLGEHLTWYNGIGAVLITTGAILMSLR
jgi:transporter family protein